MPPTITKPPGPDIRRDFTLNSELTKAFTRTVQVNGIDTEQMLMSGIASSTVRDRQGDTMTAQAQAQMLTQAQGLTMFLNHDYDVPEDVLGTCEESNLVTRNVDGVDVIDLEIVCRVTAENPRAVMAWKILQDGVKLGYSIGGAITECEVDEANDDGESWCPPLLINGLSLYEISLCGIPANPRSYTDATKSLVKELHLEVDGEAPAPTTNFAQAMRRGFVRNATRDPEVRAQLRKALPALAASKDVGDAESEAPAEGEALPQHAQAAVAASIGCLTDAMGHGMCADSLSNVQTAHKSLTDLLSPSGEQVEDPEKSSGWQLTSAETLDVAAIYALTEAQRAALFAAAKALATDPNLVLLTGAPGLDDELAQRRSEAEALAAKAKQFVEDATAAEVRKASLTTEIANLEQKLAELRDAPIGRATSSGAAGSSSEPYRQKTVQELRAELSAAVSGAGPADHLARRPA